MAATTYGQVTANTQTGVTNLQNQYKNSPTTINAQKMMNSTIDDVAKKYGFDFSRDYAKSQAEAIAQAQRNANANSTRSNESMNKLNSQRIVNDYRGAASSLDKGYFQQHMSSEQDLVNRGMNAGIAAEQALRLGMNKQAELADIWRDRNEASQEESMRYTNESQRLLDAAALVEQERLVRENQLYQDGLARGYNILGQERSFGLDMDRNEWGKTQDGISNLYRFSDLDMNRLTQEANMTGMYNGQKTWERQMEEARLALQRQQAARQQQAVQQQTTQQQQAGSLVNQFRQEQAKSNQSGTDAYYAQQRNLLTPAPPYNPETSILNKYFSPVSIQDNPLLNPWQRGKLLGG